jgi:hypothetical protein
VARRGAAARHLQRCQQLVVLQRAAAVVVHEREPLLDDALQAHVRVHAHAGAREGAGLGAAERGCVACHMQVH